MENEINITWAVAFNKDGLDIEAMKKYFIEKGTNVIDVVEDQPFENEDTEAIVFVLQTPGIVVPMDIRSELHLEETNLNYVYMPIAMD